MKNFKYYHGTSTIFIDSIKKTGLGTINPNIEWKTLEVLRFLHIEAENLIPNNDYYKNNRLSIMAMANQQNVELVMPNGVNKMNYFQHKNIYIALSIARAITHATIFKFGSEILDTSINLYKEIKKVNKAFKIPAEINIINIEHLSQCQPNPIIIEVSNVDDNDLLKEDGKTAKEALDILRILEPSLTEKQRFEFFQHCNFELLKPVSTKNLKFYKLETSGILGSSKFEYKLIEN